MDKFGHRRQFHILGASLALLFIVVFMPWRGAAAAPTSDSGNVTGWLWSGTAGWVSANCSNFGTCAASGYGLNMEDADGLVGNQSIIGQLSGWAWSSNFGWICVGQTCTDINPEGLANYADLREILPAAAPFCSSNAQCGQMENCRFNKCISKPRLYGWAQIIRLGSDGWISLNCDKDAERGGSLADTCAVSEYHILFDQGHFTLAAPYEPLGNDPDNYHWSWGGNDNGTGVGWLDWSSLFADWAPADLGSGIVYRPEGIYEPAASWPTGQEASHPYKFKVTVASVSSPPGYRLECSLGLPNGGLRTFGEPIGTIDEYGVWSGAMTGGPMTLEYAIGQSDLEDGVRHADPAEDAIQQNRLWYLEGCRLCGKVVDDRLCAQEDDCPLGYVCDEDYGKCRRIIASTPRKPIYVHQNTWTLFDANEDYYQAIKCYAGFPGQYFENANRCDFTADASFSMAMARGIPVKRDCHFFGVPACEDRFCKGISYFCPATPARRPTTCVWSEAGAAGGVGQCSAINYERGKLCCTKQPVSSGSSFSSVVNGMECAYGDSNDGYYDCDCTPDNSAKWGTGDCFAPGHEVEDLCCNAAGEVVKETP
jgi:hypothetical protein